MMCRILVTACLPVALASAQTTVATYSQYGQGCNGGRESVCIAQNDQNPSLVGTSLPNEYCHAVVNNTGQTMTVLGFSMYTATVAGTPGVIETVQTGVYRDASGAGATTHTTPDLLAEGLGTIDVDGAAAWYRTTVYPAVIVAPGETFWVGADTNAVLPPDNSTGAPGPAPSYWRRPPFGGTAWAVTGIVNNPAIRVHCMGSTDIPLLTATGTPQLGTTFNIDLSNVPASTPGAFFILAFDDTQWLGMPTPVNLAIVGMPQCYAYTSNDDATFTQAAGGMATFALAIPNSVALDGLQFYNQWAVVDPSVGNLQGLSVSNAGAGVLGI